MSENKNWGAADSMAEQLHGFASMAAHYLETGFCAGTEITVAAVASILRRRGWSDKTIDYLLGHAKSIAQGEWEKAKKTEGEKS